MFGSENGWVGLSIRTSKREVNGMMDPLCKYPHNQANSAGSGDQGTGFPLLGRLLVAAVWNALHTSKVLRPPLQPIEHPIAVYILSVKRECI